MDLTYDQLMVFAKEKLQELSYSKHTISRFNRYWVRCSNYIKQKGATLFTQDLADSFFEETYEFAMETLPKGANRNLIDCRRALTILLDIQNGATICRRVPVKNITLPGCYQHIIKEFVCVIMEEYSANTVKQARLKVELFLDFLCHAKCFSINQITKQHIVDFCKARQNLSHSTRSNDVYALRKFFAFLNETGYITINYIDCIPKIHQNRNGRIPSFYTSDEQAKILKMVDRSNPTGKRDYAIMLLAICYGMRIGDIKNVKLSSFKWVESTITFTQMKTGENVILPLLPNVATAVIDYLRNGRPETDSKFLFVRHYAPYCEYTQSNKLYEIISKYIHMAGLDFHQRKRGFHSMRHSIASNMLNQGVPLPTISEILGHTSTESTTIYTKISTDQLRGCALEVE